MGGTAAKVFFFMSKPNPCKNLNAYFQEAWKSMGLPGCPTFTDIRTAIATHVSSDAYCVCVCVYVYTPKSLATLLSVQAKNSHKPEEWYKISQFMRHDTSTADKFYAVNLNPKQAVEHRLLFEQALEGPESSPCQGGGYPKTHQAQAARRHCHQSQKETCQGSQPVIFISQ